MQIQMAEAIRVNKPEKWVFEKLQGYVTKFPEEDWGKMFWPSGEDLCFQRGLRGLLGHLPHLEDLTISINMGIPFLGQLRPYQKREISKIAVAKEGIILMPTASGKTIMMLALASLLQEKTLIITHTNTILTQIKEKIKQFCGIEAGQIGDARCEIDKPITVGLIQTIEKRISELDDKFGLIICDESAHLSAETWFRSVAKFKARHRYGFAADIHRSDHKEYLIGAILGRILVEMTADGLAQQGFLKIPEIIQVKTNFYLDKISFCKARCYKRGNCEIRVEDCNYVKNGFWSYMLGKLTTDQERNELVVKIIEENLGNYNVVLSDRIKHLEFLKEQFWTVSYLMVGKIPAIERQKILRQFEKDGGTIFATTGLLGEGYDLPKMDRLFLTCPAGTRIIVSQRLGRIMRPGEAEKRVFDFVDWRSGFLKGLWFSRYKIYKQLGCSITSEKS